MASTFMGLNISYTGLVAANAGLNTTANNIANVETVGFSRQVVNQAAASALQAYQSYGCVGAGVDIFGAERVRDIYYDEKYWTNNGKLGEFDKKAYYCDIIQTYLKDQRGSNQVKGFTTIFSEMMAGLESLSDNADQDNYALDYIGYAGNLCSYFNTVYNNFQKMQTDVNDEIAIGVNEINSIAQQITSLNKQINTIECNGTTIANELRDKRDLLIDQLSAVIDVRCEEKPKLDDHGNDTGMHDYVVRIAGGQVLVDGYRYRQLECVPRNSWQKVNQNDAEGLYDIIWTDTEQELGLQGGNVTGELKGLFEMRDGNNNEAFHGTVSKVDTLENSVKVKVTDDYLKDISKSTLPLTEGRIMLGGDYYYYDSFQFEIDDNGECYYTFKLSDSVTKNPSKATGRLEGYNARVGEQVNYQGIPYYMEQMNEWVRDYAYCYNQIYGVEGGTDLNGTVHDAGSLFFTGNDLANGGQYTLDTALNAKKYDSAGDYGYHNLTAGNFAVERSIENDPRTLITHTGETEGPAKYDILSNLKDLATNEDKMVFRGCSATKYLDCILADAALNAQSAISFQDIYYSIEESIANSRYSVSGVDNDEEAANMIKFQNAFNLASKMISVLNECYDRLITQTGV